MMKLNLQDWNVENNCANLQWKSLYYPQMTMEFGKLEVIKK